MPLTEPATDAGAPPDARDASRAGVLRSFGAGPAQTDELLAYNRSLFAVPAAVELPLPDEPFVPVWTRYADEAGARGVLPVLREHLVQLRFPVVQGGSEGEAYQAATRRGVLPEASEDLALEDADGLRLFIHPTPAGAVPVLITARRADFEALVRALTKKNEPVPLPPSMGACMVGGYNNWGRVAELCRAWEAGEVPAEAMGMEPAEWSRASVTIRLEHECAHYFTRRVLGSMRNNLLDELMADYAGIVAAAGRYRADWFLRFCGLEDADGCRAGGRLWNYRGEPPLSDAAFAVLQRIVRAAAHALERYDAGLPPAARTPEGRAGVLLSLAALTLEEIAAGALDPADSHG